MKLDRKTVQVPKYYWDAMEERGAGLKTVTRVLEDILENSGLNVSKYLPFKKIPLAPEEKSKADRMADAFINGDGDEYNNTSAKKTTSTTKGKYNKEESGSLLDDDF